MLLAALIAGTMGVAVACDGGTSSPASTGGASPKGTTAGSKVTWHEPASVLAGSFRVTVRDGKVTEAVGLDSDSPRTLSQGPGPIPGIGDLIDMLENAWQERADTAGAEYATDGHPSWITLDPDENAIDDEAEYVITAYEPGDD